MARILLVDDDPGDRALTTRALRQGFAHAEVTPVVDRASLDAALAGDPADAVVTENRLGWSSGHAVVEAVLARWPDCPVVMLSHAGGTEVAVQAMKRGVSDYLLKDPDAWKRLPAIVAEAIESARARRSALLPRAADQDVVARERALREAAERALHEKDEFLAIVSHELRAPLNAIMGWAQLLRTRHGDDATALRGLDVIMRNVRSQTRMVEELLDVSRAASGRLELHCRPLDPTGPIGSGVDALRPEAAAKRVTLTATLPAEVGPIVADPDRLEQIAWNLVANAIAFTPADGRVTVELVGRPDVVELVVRDTGEGIDATILPQVFEGFRMRDRSLRRRGGLGLGLVIVRHLIDAHGGRIAAASPGVSQGATFTVTLPRLLPAATQPHAAPVERASTERPRGMLQGVAILVVDDHADTRDVLMTALAHAGAEVRVAADAETALEALNQRPVDVVVSDIALPGSSGYELVSRLRDRPDARGRPTAALAITSYPGTEDRERALRAGFDEYLRKPYDVSTLLATVRRLAEARGGAGSR